ncbi:hypothetical protein A4A71_09640 [Nicoletella semolina]|uniref:factor H binding protein domain-containing protein n=1 Tax=Nicoletella semolina TaxID=271160 RepID=UPI00244780EE|nr:factor H binding protein domain-containing protein [Nicoletella semolina]MDH2925557.1 hypothetical protein [Nicoletella semolina]
MSIKRISIAATILLSLTACGSSGGGSGNVTKPISKVQQTTRTDKAKAEQEAKARAEAEAKAKAEQEAKARAEAEAKAKAEQEAKARAEAEAKAKAEQEAKARAEAEAKAKAEQEAEARAKEEARIVQKMKDLIAFAKGKGLSDSDAKEFAEQNVDISNGKEQPALDNFLKEKVLAEAESLKGISNHSYPVDSLTSKTSMLSSSTSNRLTNEQRTHQVIYNQPYSAVLGNYSGFVSYNNSTGYIFDDNRDSSIQVKGLRTEEKALPLQGSATYSGKAFNGTIVGFSGSDEPIEGKLFSGSDEPIEGKLSYNVNFADKTGSGSITGLGNDITLERGTISGTGISANATQSYKWGEYSLGFYGKNAEEVSGKVSFDGKDVVGFGGTRGQIQK